MYTSNIFANCVNFDAYSSWQSKGILSEIIAGSNLEFGWSLQACNIYRCLHVILL